MKPTHSSYRIPIEQPLFTRAVAVAFNNAKLAPGSDNLEEDLVVVRILAPSPGICSPHNAIAFDPAPIGPDKIIDRPYIGQEQDIADGLGDLHQLRIAIRHRCNRRSANRFGFEG